MTSKIPRDLPIISQIRPDSIRPPLCTAKPRESLHYLADRKTKAKGVARHDTLYGTYTTRVADRKTKAAFIEPMLLLSTGALPEGAEWSCRFH